MRRGAPARPTVLSVGDLSLDPAQHRVRRRDTPIELTGKEFALLECFMRHPGDVLSRRTLTEHQPWLTLLGLELVFARNS